jgi:hypothetical protein
MPKKPTHGGKRRNSGRDSLPPSLRKVMLSVWVPKRTKAILLARVAAPGHELNPKGKLVRRSSLAIEVERAVDNSQPATIPLA